VSAHSLRSLARLADRVSNLSASLNAAQATTLQGAIRRAITGDDLTAEALREILGGIEAPDNVTSSTTLIVEFIAAQRELLPSVLSAARRSDRRLVDLPTDELAALVPLWVDAARQAESTDDQGFSHLFGMIAEHADLPTSAGVVAQLRRLFLTAERNIAQNALGSLLTTVGPRTEDRRFFRRLDLHLACGHLDDEVSAALGLWLVGREDRWEMLVVNAAVGPLRHRLRAARLLVHLSRCADLLSEERVAQAVSLAHSLLTDPEPEVWREAARALARFAPYADLDQIWEPASWNHDKPHSHLRLAAGIGEFIDMDREWGASLVDELCEPDAAPPDNTGPSPRWATLARAYADLARHAPEAAAQVADAVIRHGGSEALAALGQQLAQRRLADEGDDIDRGLGQRIDQALGALDHPTAPQWAQTLAGREALLLVKGGKPSTSLALRVRRLARMTLRADSPGKVLSEAASLIAALRERLAEVDAPLFSDDTVVLGGRMHDLSDLTAVLFCEDLLSDVVTTAAPDEAHDVDRYELQLTRLRTDLRALLHRHAGDDERPDGWRDHTLDLAYVVTSAVPDHPVGRPSTPRTVAFHQLVGFPEFLQGWARDPVSDGAATQGLAVGLNALLSQSLPGGGDALLSILLLAPTPSTVTRLPSLVSHADARALLERLATVIEEAPDASTPADDRLGGLLQTVDELLTLLVDETAFTTGRLRDAAVELRRHVRTATGHERLISFMSPVRRSLEVAPETLLVVLARDIAALHRIAHERAEPARIVALRAIGTADSTISLQAEQRVSRAALDSASFEAGAIVAAEDVGDQVRRGAGAGVEDRLARAEALGQAATGLGDLSTLVADAMPGCLGDLLSALLLAWSDLVDERRARSLEEPDHPLLVDRFRIERLLGEGGMAYTYRARDPDLDRNVTLKVMKPAICQQLSLRNMFAQEGKALAALPPHPHVVQAFEFLDSETAPCLVMEYVDGEALIDVIPEEGMPIKLGLDIAIAAAQGLHHVHRHQMVHLDVKGENVMVTHDGTPKLIDFGLAQRGTEEREESEMILGTPCYMSPEQATGKALDPASDVYSFGVTLYELFTGDVPFDDADPRQILRAHVTQTPESMSMRRSGLPDGLVLLVADTLEKDKENRPWMVEVASRLQRIRSGLSPADGEGSTLARREIAVLCVALAGLEPDERLPEEAADLLETFLTASNEIVNGLGGRVDATVGDRVFAVFGYPRGDAAASEKAVRAATMIRNRIRRVSSDNLDTHAGISSGQALVGQVRGDPTDATVLGAPLEIAAYLAYEADPDSPILVDEPTYTMIRGTVETGKKHRIRGIGKAWAVGTKNT
jgi:class 3 adenylate cyclase